MRTFSDVELITVLFGAIESLKQDQNLLFMRQKSDEREKEVREKRFVGKTTPDKSVA